MEVTSGRTESEEDKGEAKGRQKGTRTILSDVDHSLVGGVWSVREKRGRRKGTRTILSLVGGVLNVREARGRTYHPHCCWNNC